MGLLENHNGFFSLKNVALREDFGPSISVWLDTIAERIRESGGEINVAYVCAEFGVDPKMPLYGGGLGILSGCTSQSFAYLIGELQKRNIKVNVFGIGLLYSHGYLAQYFDNSNVQMSLHERWNPFKTPNLTDTGLKIDIPFQKESIKARVWRYDTPGISGGVFPIYLLDTNLPENPVEERGITARLYDAANHDVEFKQCSVLGFGAHQLLRKLSLLAGEKPLIIHANEGHCATLGVGIMVDIGGTEGMRRNGITLVHQNHTVISAGMKSFLRELIARHLDERKYFDYFQIIEKYGRDPNNPSSINFPAILFRVAEETGGITFGVARLHGRILRSNVFTPGRFPDVFGSSPDIADRLSHVTNGVNHRYFTSSRVGAVLDEYVSGWREDVFKLRGLFSMIDNPALRVALWVAHEADQADYFDILNFERHYWPEFRPGVITLGFGRRAADYKRAMLMLQNTRRLIEVAEIVGGLQLVYAGLAHPADRPAKAMVRNLRYGLEDLSKSSNGLVRAAYVDNWKKDLAVFLIPAMDGWLNTPRIGLEASGTSWMKAFYNMVMLLSILDGAVPETAPDTIYPIPTSAPVDRDWHDMYWGQDSEALYNTILQAGLDFKERKEAWITKLIRAMALNGPYFSSDRMAGQYFRDVYLRRKRSNVIVTP